MAFLLSFQNVLNYLVDRNLCSEDEKTHAKVELKQAKNFNLLVSLSDQRKLLVKQEPHDREGKTIGEFKREWLIQELVDRFDQLHPLKPCISESVCFDTEHSIIVFNYLEHYRDLADFYYRENRFPVEIARQIGKVLATLHQRTFHQQNYHHYFTESHPASGRLAEGIGRIEPEIFGSVPADGLKFFALYQRYDSLGQAIAELSESMQSVCLSHNDVKLNNFLVSTDWLASDCQTVATDASVIRLIDWERADWGDPAFDLGSLIGSYLTIWLGSLITSKTISIDESLRMATTPLEALQVSIAATTIAYLETFPQILEQRPDFLKRAVQFAGLNLITVIQSTLQYQKSFGNNGICMLQVAKSLLCRPEASISTVFGMEQSDLLPMNLSSI
ncbi:aminoglycoside phosphotransferase family protein [Pseudanabaenaceae cyanobacterium LEGE 13415]|nr:aminoglycoside phosphotransferase family protein [Pseudanabaenaceae cyanobacterium LEGE 13415]